MSLFELAVYTVFMWAVIELVRRAALYAWHDYHANRFGESVDEYRAWKHDLRDRNG